MPRRPVVKVLLLRYIRGRGGSASFSELLEFYRRVGSPGGKSKGALGNILKDLVSDGLVRKDSAGRYVITEDGLRYMSRNVDILVLLDRSLNELAQLLRRDREMLAGGHLDFTFMHWIAPKADRQFGGYDLIEALGIDEAVERIDYVNSEMLEKKLSEPGWTKFWYETDDAYVLNFFDPPGINTVVAIGKEPSRDGSLGDFLEVDYWSAMIYPSKSELEAIADKHSVISYIGRYMDLESSSSFFVRLAYTYAFYHLFMIDATLRALYNTKLLLGLFVMTNSRDGKIYFNDFGYKYEVPQLLINSVNVPGLEEVGIDELNLAISNLTDDNNLV
ncbi:MAG: hypothetical protein QXP98_03540 [Thermoproteus sp.]